MSRPAFWLQLAFTLSLIVLFGLMSYFGAPNPVSLGLQSSIGIALLVVALATPLYLLPLRLALPIFSILLTACLLATVANWWHYQFFRVYFNYEFLAFARDSGDALRSIGEFAYFSQAAQLVIVFMFACLFFYSWRRCAVKRQVIYVQVLVSLCLGSWLVFSVNTSLERLREANGFTLSPYFLHPIHAFFYPLSEGVEGDYEGWASFKQKNDLVEPGFFLPGDLEEKKYNIIVITMESFRASFIGAYNSKSDLTPNFDHIVESGILFKNFYANSNYTVKGENALFCGFFDHNAKISVAEYPAEKTLNCLPKILSKLGYTSFYFHGNHGEFYNRSHYLKEVGFSDTYFHADEVPQKNDGRTYIGWGLADEDLLRLGLEDLEGESRKPFYAHFMSLSNHYPFKFDWPVEVPNEISSVSGGAEAKIYAAYQNAIHYSDHALGQFWRKFESSDLYDNTIVVITADHGVWSFGEGAADNEAQRNEEFFRMPLFIYHPEIAPRVEVSQVASQVDVPVTLLELVGADFPKEEFIGKNLFDKVKAPWAVMMKGGEVSVRIGSALCVPKKPACAGPYQSCWADTGVEDFLNNLGDSQCYQYAGDPLNGGGVEEIDGPPEVISKAIGLVSFENRRIFAEGSATDGINPTHPSLQEFNRELKNKANAQL